MMNEQDLVPYACTQLRGERLLVLAPHPDDEVIGCGGLVALHARERRRVHIVVASDGTAAEADAGHDDTYRDLREAEARSGLEALGVTGEPEFLRFPDRALGDRLEDLKKELRRILLSERPDLVVAPSPVEVHPDHVAVSRALFDVIHEEDELRGVLAVTSVAFCEVSQPIQPNALIDITSVMEDKRAAVSKHVSQQRLRDYSGFQLALSRYRALTLAGDVEAAEAYRVESASELRTMTWGQLCARVSPRVATFGNARGAALPVTVIIRTKNRENWLKEAVSSVMAGDHAAQIVVVNDGGSSPAGWLAELSPGIVVVDHSESKGRSAAMNAGVERAGTEWIAFLDDDDLYYPEHLSTLAAAASSGIARAYYTDAVYAQMTKSEDGEWTAGSRRRLFQQEFDANLLLIDNYIPLPTILVRRADFLAVGGFDPAIDLFEDWDFLIRLSTLGPLQRVPRVTCEVRQFPASGSPVLGAPEGSANYAESKKIVWRKHADRLTFDVFEAQKRRLVAHFTHALEMEGQVRRIQSDLDRLEREKSQLIEKIGAEHRRADEARQALDIHRAEAQAEIDRIEEARAAVEGQLERATADLMAKSGECESLRGLLDDHREAVADQTDTITSLYAEIERLNGVIERMRSTRAWKLHQTIERIKGQE